MFTVHGKAHRQCDGFARRDFLRLGTLALGGLSLSDVLHAGARTGSSSSRKACIMIFLSGGPSHLDTYDMKPEAPAEFRGEFSSIQTRLPGFRICEHMPMQAQIADKLAILRGVQTIGNHTGNEFYSGFAWEQGKPDALTNQKRPALGSVASRLRANDRAIPAYVSLQDNPSFEQAYYLGSSHEPFRTVQRERSNPGLANMRLAEGVTRERLADRRNLNRVFDDLRRDLDARGAMGELDAIQSRALDIIASSQVRDAFDLSKEPDHVKARYGSRPAAFGFIPGHDFLLARRLVEAGVSVVTIAVHGWDTHEKNFETLRDQLPTIDRALHALITDLEVRGMLDDVTIIMGGEMGRTPRITPGRAGREHWPTTGITVMAGGGLRVGQVVGASDSRGEQPNCRPITPAMMLSTIYHAMQIDPAQTFLSTTGRPMHVLDERQPIRELI